MGGTSRQKRGFTLVELMIVIGIIGILAAIAVPTFMLYMRKSKFTEAHLGVDKLVKNIRVYHATKGRLPQSTAVMPDTAACDNAPSFKTPAQPQSEWLADTGWAEVEFFVDEQGYFQYQWTANGTGDAGDARAFGDLDCDGVAGQLITHLEIVSTTSVLEQTTTIIDE